MADTTTNVPTTSTTTQPDSDDTTQDTSPVANANTPAPSDDELDSETGLRKGYALAIKTGAVKMTNVTPGDMFQGVRVPQGAVSTDGQNWYDKTGSSLVDSDVDPDGSTNEFSSRFIKEWSQNMLDSGVNPIFIDKLVSPWADIANKTKTFEMQNSDNVLMKMGLQTDNQTKFNNLSNDIVSNLAPMDPITGATMVQQMRANMPAGATESPVLARFGVTPQDNPTQAFQKLQASGVGQSAIQALKAKQQEIAASQQSVAASQQSIKQSQQGMVAQQFETGQQAVGSLNAGQQAVTEGAASANRAQTAKQIFDSLYNSGDIGGNYNNIMSKLNALTSLGGDNPKAAQAQELRAYLSSQNLSDLKHNIGQRFAASEYQAISPNGINPDWQAPAIRDFLGNNIKYTGADLTNKKTEQQSIISNVDKLGFGVDTSPYKQNLAGADKATTTVNQTPMVAPPKLSEIQFATWANAHGISNKNVAKAYEKYSQSQ